MAVTGDGNSNVLGAANDQLLGNRRFKSIAFSGTGLTPGEQCVLIDENAKVIYTHYIVAANENVEFIQGAPVWISGLKWGTKPTGTSTITCKQI